MSIAIVSFIQDNKLFKQRLCVSQERLKEIKRRPNVISVISYPMGVQI